MRIKMIANIRALFLCLLMITFTGIVTGCNEDEPKESEETEQPNDEDTPGEGTSGESQTEATYNALIHKYWHGSNYIVKDLSWSTDYLYIEFEPDGTGRLDYNCFDKADEDCYFKRGRHDFTYTVNGNTIECAVFKNTTCKSSADKSCKPLKLEYLDGKLHVRTPELQPLILGRYVYVNTEGNIINLTKEAVGKVWINENGKNIIDLKNDQMLRLKEKGSKNYDFYTSIIWRVSDLTPEYSGLRAVQMFYTCSWCWYWTVLDVTEDTLVLGASVGNKQYIRTYHAYDDANLPKPTDFELIFSNSPMWISGNFVLNLKEDGTFTFENYDYFVTSGKYRVINDNLELNCTEVTVPDGATNTYGFVSGQTRVLNCKLKPQDLTRVIIYIPEFGEGYYFETELPKGWGLSEDYFNWGLS